MLPDGNRVKHIHAQNSTVGIAIFCVHPLQHLAHLERVMCLRCERGCACVFRRAMGGRKHACWDGRYKLRLHVHSMGIYLAVRRWGASVQIRQHQLQVREF